MTANTLLTELIARDVHVWVENDRLKLDAPADTLTGEDKARLTEHKAELLALLLTKNSVNEPMSDGGKQPYLTEGNELIIPLFTPKRYRWWQGGQSVWATLAELGAPLDTWRRHAANRGDFLLSTKHDKWCGGNVRTGVGFAFCVECGGYAEI